MEGKRKHTKTGENDKPDDIKKTKLDNDEKCLDQRFKWQKINAENLKLDYAILYSKHEADEIFKNCEDLLEYNSGDVTKVYVFGKWHEIPRKQVAQGDPGLSYKFSGKTVPARPWLKVVDNIRSKVTAVTGYQFNFVLINRYKDGYDHIGEHRDDEKDLQKGHPIASVTFGQRREFIFRHCDTRGKTPSRKMDPVKITLEHGCLLMINHPTNTYWYHSIPQRKRLTGVRINMTFRKMIPTKH